MTRINSHRTPTIAFLIAAIFTTALPASRAEADDFPPRPLPDSDRQTLTQYLGNNIVGNPVPPPSLPHGLNDLLDLGNGLSWRVQITAGKAQGKIQSGSASLLNRPNATGSFRFDTGDGRNVLYGQLDSNGNVNCFASQDNQEGVMSRFSPPQPVFLAGMTPGESRHITSNVAVYDLSQPDVESHSGQLYIDFTYVGAYQMHVPAGNLDAVLFKTHLTGHVGPASIDDTIYRFFAKNSAPVAIVETDDVSALFIYQDKSHTGKILIETTLK
jgi:hypothetical protein